MTNLYPGRSPSDIFRVRLVRPFYYDDPFYSALIAQSPKQRKSQQPIEDELHQAQIEANRLFTSLTLPALRTRDYRLIDRRTSKRLRDEFEAFSKASTDLVLIAFVAANSASSNLERVSGDLEPRFWPAVSVDADDGQWKPMGQSPPDDRTWESYDHARRMAEERNKPEDLQELPVWVETLPDHVIPWEKDE